MSQLTFNPHDNLPTVRTKLNANFSELYSKDATLTTGLADLDADKVDKVTGKGLSTEDYTTANKTFVDGASAVSGGVLSTLSYIGSSSAYTILRRDSGTGNVEVRNQANNDYAGLTVKQFTAGGQATFSGGLTLITGPMTILSSSTFSGSVAINSGITVAGGASFTSTLNASGASTFSGATAFSNTASFSGLTTVSGTLNVSGIATFSGASNFSGETNHTSTVGINSVGASTTGLVTLTQTATKSWTLGPITAGSSSTTTITVPGVVAGDPVIAAVSGATADLAVHAAVTSSDTVTVKVINTGSTTLFGIPTITTLRVNVIKMSLGEEIP